MDMPKAALAQLAELEKSTAINPTRTRKIAEEIKEIPLRRIELLFRSEEAEEFLKLAESMYVKLKVTNVTDFSLVAARKLKKLLK